jgi:hypothetical protein
VKPGNRNRIFIGCCIGLVVVLAAWNAFFAMGYLATGLFGGFWLLILAASGCAFLGAEIFRKRELAKKAVVIALLACFGVILGEMIQIISRRMSLQRGEALVSAIQEFKTRTGRYPDSLKEVAGNGGERLPTNSCMGLGSREIRYERADNGFRLSFDLPKWKLLS